MSPCALTIVLHHNIGFFALRQRGVAGAYADGNRDRFQQGRLCREVEGLPSATILLG